MPLKNSLAPHRNKQHPKQSSDDEVSTFVVPELLHFLFQNELKLSRMNQEVLLFRLTKFEVKRVTLRFALSDGLRRSARNGRAVSRQSRRHY